MSKLQKNVARILAKPVEYIWDELMSLMISLGFELRTSGGSSRKFFDSTTNASFFMQEPHPSKVLKAYRVQAVVRFLRNERKIP